MVSAYSETFVSFVLFVVKKPTDPSGQKKSGSTDYPREKPKTQRDVQSSRLVLRRAKQTTGLTKGQ